jgi:hypothetical protein
MKHIWKNDDLAFGAPDLTYCSVCNTVQFVDNIEEECKVSNQIDESDIVYRLRKRAEIRRQIPSRKSVQEGKPDRIADLLEEAANVIELQRNGKK